MFMRVYLQIVLKYPNFVLNRLIFETSIEQYHAFWEGGPGSSGIERGSRLVVMWNYTYSLLSPNLIRSQQNLRFEFLLAFGMELR